MKRTAQYVTTGLFFLFLLGFGLIHLLLPDRSFSPVENRNLSQLPSFSWAALADGSYTADLETYLADQFPGRDSWMGLQARWQWLLGRREFNGVFLCGDTLISQVTDNSLGERNLGYIASLAQRTDIPVCLGLIPTAAEIWREKLPEGAWSYDQLAFLERARDLDVTWVDMAAALGAHREEPIYYRTDHHWTSLGAYYGYTALMEALGERPKALGDGQTMSENFNGTLYSTSGVHWLAPDTIQRYVTGEGVTVEDVYAGATHGLYVDSFLEEKDQYAFFLGGNGPLYIVRNPGAALDRKLLVVRDSYSDSLAPFLSQSFSEVHLLDLRYYRTSVARYAQEQGIDQIFICYSVENFLRDADAVFLGQ